MNGDRHERLTIRSNLSELDTLFAFIDGFCQRATIPDDIKHKLFLVVEELAVNAISHGYDGRLDGVIDVVLELKDREIEVCIADEAPAFDPLSGARAPDTDAALEDRPIGGLGVHLIKTLAKTVDYRFNAGRNIVRVTIGDVA